VQRWLGHSDPGFITLRTYVHPLDDDLGAALITRRRVSAGRHVDMAFLGLRAATPEDAKCALGY